MQFALWKYPIHFLAYGLGTGLSPVAPGTVGTLVGVALYWFMAPLSPGIYAGATGLLFLAGIYISGQTARDIGAKDPGMIVYDEIVGFLVTMFMLPREWPWILAGFLLFRLFDIWKPWPIQAAEKKFGLGTGIMIDDVVAALYALALLHAARLLLERMAA